MDLLWAEGTGRVVGVPLLVLQLIVAAATCSTTGEGLVKELVELVEEVDERHLAGVCEGRG